MWKLYFFIYAWPFIYASYAIYWINQNNLNQNQNINSHQQIYLLEGIMISC
jgi:hypothetical protein